jgi:Ubiquitin carboxyl-terminal hydrolase, family 1
MVQQMHDDSRAHSHTQLVNNACSTQAILSILLNCDDMLDVGDDLRSFRESTKDYNPLVSSVTDLISTATAGTESSELGHGIVPERF